jgi:hypothetical protein
MPSMGYDINYENLISPYLERIYLSLSGDHVEKIP